MPKGYMISAHRSERDPVKGAAYSELAEGCNDSGGWKVFG